MIDMMTTTTLITGSGGGCDFRFPDEGSENILINLANNDYVVPEEKYHQRIQQQRYFN